MKIPFNYFNPFKGKATSQEEQAQRVVLSHVLWSTGAGFIPLPVADMLAVAAIQLDMVRSLSSVYQIDFKESEGKAIISALTGAGLSRLGAKTMLKFIPGIGALVGGGAMALLSGASTYAIGQVFRKHFENGGNFMNLNTDDFKRFYEEQFEKGKKVAEDVQKEAEKAQEDQSPKGEPRKEEEPVEAQKEEKKEEPERLNIVQQLKELGELRTQGIISDEEFESIKKEIIKHYGAS